MKKQVRVALFGLALSMTSPALAAVERWEGSGVTMSPDGQVLESYNTSTVVNPVGAGVVDTETTIVLPSGETKKITMEIKSDGSKFSTDSSLGHGGGACYGQGLCESYIEDGKGRAYATTIIEDSAGSRRHLTIVLENGKAIKVLRDKVSLAK